MADAEGCYRSLLYLFSFSDFEADRVKKTRKSLSQWFSLRQNALCLILLQFLNNAYRMQ